MGQNQFGCDVASACSISDNKDRSRSDIAGIVIALRRQLRDRTVKASTDCWDNGYLKRSRRDDHRLGDYVPAIIDLRDEPLISPTFELNHAISGEDGQVEMAGIGFEIVRKLSRAG